MDAFSRRSRVYSRLVRPASHNAQRARASSRRPPSCRCTRHDTGRGRCPPRWHHTSKRIRPCELATTRPLHSRGGAAGNARAGGSRDCQAWAGRTWRAAVRARRLRCALNGFRRGLAGHTCGNLRLTRSCKPFPDPSCVRAPLAEARLLFNWGGRGGIPCILGRPSVAGHHQGSSRACSSPVFGFPESRSQDLYGEKLREIAIRACGHSGFPPAHTQPPCIHVHMYT